MRLGTKVWLPDGRVGTVVYNSLIGVGIKWGLHDPDPPDALLREPWPTCELYGFKPEQCVGSDYEILSDTR